MDWGDEFSNWEEPYYSGETIITVHTWKGKGNNKIKVKAKNIGGAESEWSDPLAVSMPKKQTIH